MHGGILRLRPGLLRSRRAARFEEGAQPPAPSRDILKLGLLVACRWSGISCTPATYSTMRAARCRSDPSSLAVAVHVHTSWNIL